MRHAFAVLDAWGFETDDSHVGKAQMGTGDWLRGQTEHCLLAVRGKPALTLTNQTTLLHGPVRGHPEAASSSTTWSRACARHRATPICSRATGTTTNGTATATRRRPRAWWRHERN